MAGNNDLWSPWLDHGGAERVQEQRDLEAERKRLEEEEKARQEQFALNNPEEYQAQQEAEEAERIESEELQELQEEAGTANLETEAEATLVGSWNQGKFTGDQREAYNHWKDTGEFDKSLLGAETQATIEAEKMKDEEYKRQPDEKEEDYYARIGKMQTEDALGTSPITNNMVTRAFHQLFQTQQLQGSGGNENLIRKSNDRIEELQANKGSMDPEEYEKELKRATSIKNSLEFLNWERWQKAEDFQRGQAAGKEDLDLVDKDGNTDWGKVWKAAKSGSLLSEVVTQLPNTVIAGLGKGVAQIPGILFFGAQMANEYRAGLINDQLDKQYGRGKWGKEEYLKFVQSDEGASEINKARMYGFAAGQVDRMVDRISFRGLGGNKIPGIGKAKDVITRKAVELVGPKGAAILGGLTRFGIETQTEKETEQLQEEIGSALNRGYGKDDIAGVEALQRMANWHFGGKTMYSAEEVSQIGNLRTLTGITAGILSGPGSIAQTTGEINKIRRINEGRHIGKTELTQERIQALRPGTAIEQNQASLDNALALAKEYEGKEMPQAIKNVVAEEIEKVELRNNNHQVIIGEHSAESVENLGKIKDKIAGFQDIAEDPNVSDSTKAWAESQISIAKARFDQEYYSPLRRQEARNEYKTENIDEFSKLDEINRKLQDKSLTATQKADLITKRNQYTTEIKGKQKMYLQVDNASPTNNIDAIRDIKDRRLNPRKDKEPRGVYNRRIIKEVNNEIGKAFQSKGLSGPQKSRLVKELLDNNKAWINKQVNAYKRTKQGTNFSSAFTPDDFKQALETQMIKNAETWDPKAGKFSTRIFSGTKQKAWNIAKKLEAGIRDKSRDTWGEKFVPLAPQESGGKSVEDSLAASDDNVQVEESNYDPSKSYEMGGNSDDIIRATKYVHGLSEQQVQDYQDTVASTVKKLVGDGTIDIRKGEGKFMTKLHRAVRKPLETHLKERWGKKTADQLAYLEDNFAMINAVFPNNARNGKFLGGLMQDTEVTVDEVLSYFKGLTPKEQTRQLRKFRDAMLERVTDIVLEQAQQADNELLLWSDPSFQLTEELYTPQRKLRDRTIEGLDDRLTAAWAGTGVKIVSDAQGWKFYSEGFNVPSNAAGFQIGNTVVLNPKRSLADTQLHELGHVFLKGMKRVDSERYAQGVNLIKDSKYLSEIIENPTYQEQYGPYEGNEDIYHEEALATAIGREGSELFDRVSQANQWDSWVNTFKNVFKKMFGIAYDPNMSLQDWINNTSVDIIQGNGIVAAMKANQKDPAYQLDMSPVRARQIVDSFGDRTNLKRGQQAQLDAAKTVLAKPGIIDPANLESVPLTDPIEAELRAKFPNHPEALIRNLARTQREKQAKGRDSQTLTENLGRTQESEAYGPTTGNLEGVELGYDAEIGLSPQAKSYDVMEDVLKRNPFLLEKGVGWAKVPEAEKTVLRAIVNNDNNLATTMTMVKNNLNGADIIKERKIKIYEAKKALKHALKTSSELEPILSTLRELDVDPQMAVTEANQQRMIDVVRANPDDFPPAIVKQINSMVEALDPNAFTIGGNQVNLTGSAHWKSAKGREEDLTDIIAGMSTWPRALQENIFQQIEIAFGSHKIDPADSALRETRFWTGALNRLEEKGLLDAGQKAQLLEQVKTEEVKGFRGATKTKTVDGINLSKAKGRLTEGQLGLKDLMMTVFDTIGGESRPAVDNTVYTDKRGFQKTTSRSTDIYDPSNFPSKSAETSYFKRAEAWKEAATVKQELLKDILNRMGEAVRNKEMSLDAAWRLNYMLFNDQSGLGRTASSREYYDTNAVGNSEFTVEHMFPTNTMKTAAFATAISGGNLDNLFKNFVAMDLGHKDDKSLEASGLQDATVKEIFNEKWEALGTIPGTEIPLSVLRYMNSKTFVNPFRLKRYDDGGKTSLANELGIPSEFENVFKNIDEGKGVEYKGVAYQIIDNAAERKVLKAKEIAAIQKGEAALLEEPYIPVTTKPQKERSGKTKLNKDAKGKVSGFITDEEFDIALANNYEAYKAAQERSYQKQRDEEGGIQFTTFDEADFAGQQQAIKSSPSSTYSQELEFRNPKDNETLQEINNNLYNEAERRHIGYQLAAPVDLDNKDAIDAVNDLLTEAWGNSSQVGPVKITTSKAEMSKWTGRNQDYFHDNLYGMVMATPDANAIFVNADKTTLETSIHEMGHLWSGVVKNTAPEIWYAITEQLHKSPEYKNQLARMVGANFYKEGVYYKMVDGQPVPTDRGNDELLAGVIGKKGEELFKSPENANKWNKHIADFWNQIKTFLGFDPATKNFKDLTIDEVLTIAVQDIMEGEAGKNLRKLKDVKSPWYNKKRLKLEGAHQAPSFQIDAINEAKLNAVNDLLQDDSLYNSSNKFKLGALKELIAARGKDLTSRELDSIYNILEGVKSKKANREQWVKHGNDFFSDATGITDTVNPNQVGVYEQEKKSWLSKIASGIGLSKMLAPRSNNDFFGLLYDLLPSHGQKREQAKQWQKENIIDPLNDANYEYMESKFQMQNNQNSALAAWLGQDSEDVAKNRKAANRAKKKLQKPNKAGITVHGQVLSDAQIIRIFNHLKDPQLLSQIKETLSDSQIDEVIKYIQGDAGLTTLSQRILENYATPTDMINQKMQVRGHRGVGKYIITEEQKNNPILQQIYGGKENIPTYAPYSPMTASANEDQDFVDYFNSQHDVASVMSGRLKQRTYGGKYLVSEQDIFSDLNSYVGPNGPLRTANFLDFATNMSGFLSKDNLSKAAISPKLGDTWVRSMKDSMQRIVSGRNRRPDLSKNEQKAYDWLNRSVASVMFFNVRSAVLQWLSLTNYAANDLPSFLSGIGSLNDTALRKRAQKAMANSAWFHERGKGATQLELEEIFSQGNKELFGSRTLGKILQESGKYGYNLTKWGDKNAIKYGGIPFIMGKIKKYEEAGLKGKDAEDAAIKDFIASAEESQQSSRPERLGSEQTGMIGRMMLAFANTPQQYNRIMARSLKDMQAAIKNRDAKGAAAQFGRIMYYGAWQNAIFTMSQQLLFGALGRAVGDDEKREDEEALWNGLNSATDTMLRGSGIYGAIISTIKNLVIEANKKKRGTRRNQDKTAKYFQILANTAPAIGNKFTQLKNITRPTLYSRSRGPLAIKHAEIYRGAHALNLAMNLPADRAVKLWEQGADAFASDLEAIERLGRVAGWERFGMDARSGKKLREGRLWDSMEDFFEDIID